MDKPGFKTAEDFGDPNKFYRVFSGNQAYEDILESGKIRTVGSPSYRGDNPHLMLSESPSLADRIKAGRPTAWPSFAKGKAKLSYAKELPDHYIIETEEKLITPKRGRHSPGSTYFPMDEKGLAVDETKTKIYKHLGEGKYEQVRSTNKGFGTAAKEMEPSSLAEKYKAAENASIERGAKKLLSGNVGKAAPYELSVLEKFIRPAGGAIAGAVEAIPPINKYLDKEPTASMAEAALSPEGSKGIARGVGAVAGMEAGAELGAMSPVLKGPATLAGAIGGSMAGAKLGEMLTGIPAVDALITKAYEKQLREREAKMVEDTKASAQ